MATTDTCTHSSSRRRRRRWAHKEVEDGVPQCCGDRVPDMDSNEDEPPVTNSDAYLKFEPKFQFQFQFSQFWTQQHGKKKKKRGGKAPSSGMLECRHGGDGEVIWVCHAWVSRAWMRQGVQVDAEAIVPFVVDTAIFVSVDVTVAITAIAVALSKPWFVATRRQAPSPVDNVLFL